MELRRHIKSTLEHGALWSGISGAMRRRHRGDVLVLAYHNIVPTGAPSGGDLSLHLPQLRFAEQLDALARTHDIITLERALAGHDGERPAAVITFDDAYEGAVTVGVAELAARKLPATFFVAPAYLNGGDFWWDAFTAPGTGALSPTLRSWALDDCAGRDADIRTRAPREYGAHLSLVPSHARGAHEYDLLSAASVPGITLASHTWSHPNLARLAGDALASELVRPLVWLRERFSNVLAAISYPYGLASAQVERAAADAGYTAGLRIEGGWMSRNGADANAFALPRLDIPSGLSAAGFELRVAGVRVR
ncbi:MAG TPA: polysaccharide deacetylase family protein [Gemmatimonadaceae bacterium]|nr:polysaccharide deacetylase family protein [Gemmatimonadaceae bacterium]